MNTPDNFSFICAIGPPDPAATGTWFGPYLDQHQDLYRCNSSSHIFLDFGANSSLVLQGRYYSGLTDAIDDGLIAAKNSGLGFFAGMEFQVGN